MRNYLIAIFFIFLIACSENNKKEQKQSYIEATILFNPSSSGTEDLLEVNLTYEVSVKLLKFDSIINLARSKTKELFSNDNSIDKVKFEIESYRENRYKLKFYDSNEERGITFLNYYVSFYNDYLIEQELKIFNANLTFIEGKIKVLQDSLNSSANNEKMEKEYTFLLEKRAELKVMEAGYIPATLTFLSQPKLVK